MDTDWGLHYQVERSAPRSQYTIEQLLQNSCLAECQNLQVIKDRIDAEEGIEFAVLRPWTIIQCEVEPGKEKRPAGLASIQTFGSANVL